MVLSRNWYDMAGTGDLKHYSAGTNVKVLTSKREVFFYVSKYMGKVEAGQACPGRFWGVVHPKNIPMGQRKMIPCTGKQAAQLMRFMRRYVHAVSIRAKLVASSRIWPRRSGTREEGNARSSWHGSNTKKRQAQ